MKEYAFIKETSNFQKIRAFIITFFVFFVIGTVVFFSFYWYRDAVLSSTPFRSIQAFVKEDMAGFTSLGLFYWSFIASLFFLPSPIELFFYMGLKNGNYVGLSFFFVIAGTMLAHFVDYFLGEWCSPFLLNFISRRKVYKVRRWFDKYGSYAIFTVGLVPTLPSDILVFALGMARSNPTRIFFFLLLSSIIKFGVIVLFFWYVY